jgi:hypothetical protein
MVRVDSRLPQPYWVEVHITETDPLLNPLAPPDPPEATPQNLKPFLGSVNPHGPGWY